MAVGDIITSGAPPATVALANTIGASKALAEALAAYLLRAEFRVHGGTDPQDRTFKLTKVLEHFPRPDERLVYPCASIEEKPGANIEQWLSPAPLEDTWGQFDRLIGENGSNKRTVLWLTGEASVDFQLDFWLDTEADREAVEARVSDLFVPEEGRQCLVIEGPALYYGQPCTYSLEGMHSEDTTDTATRNERRLRCEVHGTCAIVSLRVAREFKPRTVVVAFDGEDPDEPQEE